MSFLKRVLSTVVGIFAFFIIGFFFIAIIGLIFQKSTSKSKVAKNSILELNLNYPLLDNGGKVKYKGFSFLDEDNKDGLFDLINAINYAAEDDNIKGISIAKPMSQAGITQLKSIREALEDFKTSGKFVTAYADIYSQKDYYLSSVADTVFLSPVGMLDFKGLSSELLYMKDLQEKSGIKMDVVRLGKYKSAVEPFLNNEISNENKEQILSYLNSIWGSLRKEIGESRNISAEHLDTIADQLLARTPERAKEVGLIDKISYNSEYEKGIRHALGLDEDDKIKSMNLVEYAKQIANEKDFKFKSDKIAVIYAQGEIVYGKGSVDKIGPEAMTEAIQKARKDDKVKAIVLRVNSPGGDALSSDIIWKELEIAKKEKPVIVSMGDLAASGGYYISAGGDKIFAEPSTITGSIGVFGIFPNVKGLADKIGVNAQQVKTNNNAITYSPFEDMTNDQRDLFKEYVNNTYTLFKERVSAGRNLSMDEVEKIAQGRVWTGEQALKNGLVDELGGLDEALNYAAELTDLDDYQIKEYPTYKVDLQNIFRKYGIISSKNELLKDVLGDDIYPLVKDYKNKYEHKGVQLMFPYSTEIK